MLLCSTNFRGSWKSFLLSSQILSWTKIQMGAPPFIFGGLVPQVAW